MEENTDTLKYGNVLGVDSLKCRIDNLLIVGVCDRGFYSDCTKNSVTFNFLSISSFMAERTPRHFPEQVIKLQLPSTKLLQTSHVASV